MADIQWDSTPDTSALTQTSTQAAPQNRRSLPEIPTPVSNGTTDVASVGGTPVRLGGNVDQAQANIAAPSVPRIHWDDQPDTSALQQPKDSQQGTTKPSLWQTPDLGTLNSDLYAAGKSIVELPGRAVAYAATGMPS